MNRGPFPPYHPGMPGRPVAFPVPIPGRPIPNQVRPPVGSPIPSQRVDPQDVSPIIGGAPRGVPVVEVERPLSGMYPSNIGNEQTLTAPDQVFDDLGFTPYSSVVVLENSAVACSQGESLILCLALDVLTNDVQEDKMVVPQVRARVRFGNGATSKSVLLDWLNGTQVAFGAKNVYVEALYRLAREVGDTDTLTAPPSFRLKAMTSYGTLNQNSHGARLTEFVGRSTAGSTVIKVPDFATAFTVVPFGSAAWTGVLSSWGDNQGVEYSGGGAAITNATYNVENAFPIFNGARFLEISNAGGDFAAAVIFDLAF